MERTSKYKGKNLINIPLCNMPKVCFCLAFILFSIILNAQTNNVFHEKHNKRWVDSIFLSLNLDEKIGQLLMPRGNYSGKPYNEEQLVEWIAKYKIGGIVWFAGNPTQQAAITNRMQALSKIPLLIGEDFEWGLAMRLDSTVRFPYQLALGAMQHKEELVEQMGMEIGRQCKRIGVHINYAPVVDVNNNPNNPVINFRSFGGDKNQVARYGVAYMKGMQSQGIIATAKHFPGHGDTQVDSHNDLPVINHDIARLKEIELFPFQQLIDSGLLGIMTAHLSIPALDDTPNLASTLSPRIINDVLKRNMGFSGLVFTDAMEMKAIEKYHPGGEAIVKALIAGNDIIETFMDVPTAVKAIKDALSQKRISIDEIEEKVKRILQAKSFVGLDRYRPIDLKNLVTDLNTHESYVLNHTLAEAMITLQSDKTDLIPIQDLNKKIAVLSVDETNTTYFQKMAGNYTNVSYFNLPLNASDSARNVIFSALQSYDLILAGMHMQEVRPSKNYGWSDSNKKTFEYLIQLPNAIVCYFGNVFGLINTIKSQPDAALLLAYQSSSYQQNACAQMIFGALPIEGKLPVYLNEFLNIGSGIVAKSIDRLSYGISDQVGVSSISLNSDIDSLLQLGLNEKAYPGAVVSIAYKGKVIFQKAYGNTIYDTKESSSIPTYSNNITSQNRNDVMDESISGAAIDKNRATQQSINNHALRTDHIFDLASITKIAASALAILQESSNDRFDINAPFYQYVPSLKFTDKGSISFKDMLTHRAGLKPWIPFWQQTIDTISTFQSKLLAQPEFVKNLSYIAIYHKKYFGYKAIKWYDYTLTIQQKPAVWESLLNTIVWKKGIYSNQQSIDCNVKLHDNLWLSDKYSNSIFDIIAASPLKPGHGYMYSDLHYYFYPKLFQTITGQAWQEYLQKTYRDIGATTLGYLPIQRFSLNQIVPTEYDSTFRHKLIHGYVHDEGAAMIGGISGHAGLFGNANDLTKLMQLYLQKGSYGGKKYFKDSIIDLYTAYQFPEEKNRRAIGFDKKDFDEKVGNAPALASTSAYGHSGFTGTYAWIDPQHQIVYVFLSNRVYPTRKNSKLSELNIRTALGDIIYNAIGVTPLNKQSN